MQKAELIERLANRLQTSKSQAAQALDGTLQVMTEAILEGRDVQLRGFGSFSHKTLASRQGKLPNGQPIVISSRKRIRFSPAKAILDRL